MTTSHPVESCDPTDTPSDASLDTPESVAPTDATTAETAAVDTAPVDAEPNAIEAVDVATLPAAGVQIDTEEGLFESADALAVPIDISPELLVRIIEGFLLAAGKPLQVSEIAELFDAIGRPDQDAIRAALAAIAQSNQGRGFELREVASGFRFQVIQEVAPWVARLWEERPQKYSRALLETLALIAYRQPITRGDIEDIRGVAVASNIVKTLLEREWVRVVGHKDVPGRPAMYATTRKFLDYFDLKNLDDLPALTEIRDFDTLNAELALEGADTLLQDDTVAVEAGAKAQAPSGESSATADTGLAATDASFDEVTLDQFTLVETAAELLAVQDFEPAQADVDAVALDAQAQDSEPYLPAAPSDEQDLEQDD